MINQSNKFILALGSTGQVYQSNYPKTGILGFKEVKELKGKTFIDISGTYHHCFAVSKEGKLYGYGNNTYCILGVSKKKQKLDSFKLINSIPHKIVEVYAGYSHSLFKTKEGKIYGCGWNYSGEVTLDFKPGKEIVYPPCKISSMSGKVSFCCVGEFEDIFYVNCDVPVNTPNQKISKPLFWVMNNNIYNVCGIHNC